MDSQRLGRASRCVQCRLCLTVCRCTIECMPNGGTVWPAWFLLYRATYSRSEVCFRSSHSVAVKRGGDRPGSRCRLIRVHSDMSRNGTGGPRDPVDGARLRGGSLKQHLLVYNSPRRSSECQVFLLLLRRVEVDERHFLFHGLCLPGRAHIFFADDGRRVPLITEQNEPFLFGL